MVEAEKIIIRPIISEKSYAQIDHSRYTFEVHPDAHKTMIAQAVQQLFNVTVVGVSTANVRPKPKRRGSHAAAAPRRGRRPSCSSRPATRSNSSRAGNGHQAIQADLARPPVHDGRHVRGHHAQRAGALAGGAAQEERRPQQLRAHHHASQGRRPQAALPHHRLQAGQGRRAGQGRADRVRPEPLGAHRPAPLRGRREALHPRAAGPQGRATSSSPARPPTSSPATRCRSRTSRRVPPSTTSSSSRAAAASWSAAPARAPSCRPRRRGTASSVSPPESCVASVSPVARRWASSATRTTRTSPAARPAAPAGAACVRPCAARP